MNIIISWKKIKKYFFFFEKITLISKMIQELEILNNKIQLEKNQNNEEKENFKYQITIMKEERDQLDFQIKELIEKERKLKNDYSSLQDNFYEEKNQLILQLNELTNINKKISVEKDQIKEENLLIRKEKDLLNDKMNEFKKMNEDQEKIINNLQMECYQTQEKEEKIRNEYNEKNLLYEQHIQQLKIEKENFKKKLEGQYNNQIDIIKKNFDKEKEKIFNDFEKSYNEFKIEKENIYKDLEISKNELQKIIKEKEILLTQIEEFLNKQKYNETIINEQNQKIEQYLLELHQLKENQQAIQNNDQLEKDNLNYKIKLLEEEINNKENITAELKKKIESLVEEQQTMKEKGIKMINELKENLTKTTEEKETLLVKIESLQQSDNSIQEIINEYKQLKEEKETFKSQKIKQTKEFLTLKENLLQKIKIYEQENVILKSKLEELEKQKEIQEQQKLELEKKIEKQNLGNINFYFHYLIHYI